MTNEEKDKLILKMYEKRLSYLKGEISEESYFKYVNNNTVDKLCTNKNGYKNLDSKLKATKNFIKKYFRSVPTLKNIDKYNELERLEKEFKNKKNKIDIVTLRLRKEDVYNKYIDYCKGFLNRFRLLNQVYYHPCYHDFKLKTKINFILNIFLKDIRNFFCSNNKRWLISTIDIFFYI